MSNLQSIRQLLLDGLDNWDAAKQSGAGSDVLSAASTGAARAYVQSLESGGSAKGQSPALRARGHDGR